MQSVKKMLLGKGIQVDFVGLDLASFPFFAGNAGTECRQCNFQKTRTNEPTQIQVSPSIFPDLERASPLSSTASLQSLVLRSRGTEIISIGIIIKFRVKWMRTQRRAWTEGHQPIFVWTAFGKNRKDTARTVWITSGAFKHYRESWIHIDIRKLFRKELKAQGGCRHLSVSVLLVRADKIRDDQRRKVRFFIEWVKWWTHVNITTCDIWFFISL